MGLLLQTRRSCIWTKLGSAGCTTKMTCCGETFFRNPWLRSRRCKVGNHHSREASVRTSRCCLCLEPSCYSGLTLLCISLHLLLILRLESCIILETVKCSDFYEFFIF